MKNFKSFIERLFLKVKAYYQYRLCSNHYRQYLLKSGYSNSEQVGEKEYIAKWSQLSKRVEPYSYRFFSHFCGQSPDIVPEDIGNMIIERSLNIPSYRSAYADKNMFSKILGVSVLPKTIICRVNSGPLLDSEYNPIGSEWGGVFIWNRTRYADS